MKIALVSEHASPLDALVIGPFLIAKQGAAA
jgi:hypothetical protein